MSNSLEKEFLWYLGHQKELASEYEGKYIAIKSKKVIGTYGGLGNAVDETAKTYKLGTFLVQKCTFGDKDTKAIFHSRVALS